MQKGEIAMQFGMPTLVEINSAEQTGALCRELGLDFIELNMNLPEYQANRLDIDRLLWIADEYGIYYTVHLDENLNPCDFNDRVAEAYTETVLQTIKAAKRLSVPVLNMHLNCGVWFTLPGKKVFLFEKYEPEYLRKLTAFRDSCTAAIGTDAIKICIENSDGYNRAPFLVKSLDILLQSPVFALTFDTGHNAAIGFADEQIITERADRLYHMHIHDAKPREKRDHLILGEGELDLQKYLKLANAHNCRVVIEVKTVQGLHQSVKWLNERNCFNG
jgi:sugar phosphate isomerase/epimerase